TARVISSSGSFQVIAYPKAWTPGTNGAVEGDAVIAVINNEQDFAKFRGQLRGKYVMTATMPDVQAQFQAPGHRFTDEELLTMSNQPVQPPRSGGPGQRGAQNAGGRGNAPQNFNDRRNQFFIDEGVAATIDPSRGSGGTLFVQSGGGGNLNDPPLPPRVGMAVGPSGRIWRRGRKTIPVRFEMNIENK